MKADSESATFRQISLVLAQCLKDHGFDGSSAAAAKISIVLITNRVNEISNEQIRQAIPDDFLIANEVTSEQVVMVLNDTYDVVNVILSLRIPVEAYSLVQVDDFETFRKASSVDSTTVAKFAAPFNFPEQQIKKMVAYILGEPTLQKDWGGEFDDLFSGQMKFAGRRVTVSFLLKGPSLKGEMKLDKLGKNGDQLDRLLLQPAEVFVVQHVDNVSAAVRRHLARGITSLRSSGTNAIGSVWDGKDTARVAVAYGFVDENGTKLSHPAWK